MRIFKDIRIRATVVFLMLMAAAPAVAVEIKDPLGGQTFADLVTNIANFALMILGPLSTIVLLIAGAMYMTGGGNPAKITRAHQVFIWALVGIAVVLLAKSAELIVRQVLKV